jgi:hypothetical protein
MTRVPEEPSALGRRCGGCPPGVQRVPVGGARSTPKTTGTARIEALSSTGASAPLRRLDLTDAKLRAAIRAANERGDSAQSLFADGGPSISYQTRPEPGEFRRNVHWTLVVDSEAVGKRCTDVIVAPLTEGRPPTVANRGRVLRPPIRRSRRG